MYLYFLKRQKLSHPDIGDYLSYGIGAYKLFGGTKPLVFIPDVSTDGKAVFQLALRCTGHGLDPKQLLDVVEDFIG